MTDTTTSDEVFDVFEDQAEVAEETTDQVETDESEEGSEEDSPDEEFEDYEEDGKTYKVPKDLKGHLLRNSDYTRKTQELAEQRRAFEADRVKATENDEAIEVARFEQRKIQNRLSDLQALSAQDWNDIRIMDQQRGTNNYDALQREFLTLPRQADEVKRTLDEKVNAVRDAQQQTVAKQIADGQAILARDIPGWGPELGAKLTDFVQREFGVTAEKHGQAFMDPAMVKLAHAAFLRHESARKDQTQQRAEAIRKAPQANVVKGAAPANGIHDKLSPEEWARRRNQQLAARGKR